MQAITGVAVVDDTGKLRGNLSLRDLKAMSTDARFFWRLYQTVENYIVKLKREVKGIFRWTSCSRLLTACALLQRARDQREYRAVGRRIHLNM